MAGANGFGPPNGSGPVNGFAPSNGSGPVNGSGSPNGFAPPSGPPAGGMPPNNSSGPVPPPNGVARISGAFSVRRARNSAPAAPEQQPQAPAGDGTRISEALSGGTAEPFGPPSMPPAQSAQQRSAAPNAFAPPPGRPPQNPDMESTTQHAAVPPAPGQPQRTKVVAGVAATEHGDPQALQRSPQQPGRGQPAGYPDGYQADGYQVDDYAAFDEYAEADDYDYDGYGDYGDTALADPDVEYEEAGGSEEVAEIDATLARFSAVHDQIATEEAQRRKKYAWLFGMRREPELGRDIPFDFVEGRDAAESRMQYKKQSRKQQKKKLMIVVGAVVLLLVGIIALVAL